MEKLSKDFIGKEILVCGVSNKDGSYYNLVEKYMTENMVKVYGLPTTPEMKLEFKPYPDIASLPHVPACAFLLCSQPEMLDHIKELKEAGISKLILYKSQYVTEPIQSYCEENGIEVRTGCPLLLYGRAMCGLHATFTGYRSERKKQRTV